jgi:hypothetical protein
MNLTYKKYPSKYELQYVKWNGINFDRERLIKFINRLKLTYFLSFIPYYRKEHQILTEILDTYDKVRIKGLLNGDENIIQIAYRFVGNLAAASFLVLLRCRFLQYEKNS